MGVFPKLKKKYRQGGTVDNPVTGVGIQYVSSAPEIANLDALKYFDEVRRRSDEQLEAERQKRKPNEQAIRDFIHKQPGTTGQKNILLNEVVGAIRGVESKIKENPNWIFTDEGKEAVRAVEDVISPGKFQKMADNSRLLNASYENAWKNQTLDKLQIRDGRVSVVDEEGKRQEIPLSEYEKDASSEKPKYKGLTIGSAFDMANSFEDFDLSQQGVYGDMPSTLQALTELKSSFDNTGYHANSNGIVSVKSNEANLRSAKEQAVANLSSRAKESLQAEYAKLNNNKFSESGFNQWLGVILDDEVRKRKIVSNDTDLRAIASLTKGSGADNSSSSGIPTEVPVNQNFPVARDLNMFKVGRQKTVNLHMGSRGSIPDRSMKTLSLNGSVFLFGDESGFGGLKTSEDSDGQIQTVKNKTFKNAMHIENATFAVTTGMVMKRGKNGSFENPSKTGDSGKILIKDEDYQNGIPADAEIKQDNDSNGNSYLYFENKEGNRVIVQMRGFKVFDVFDETEKDAAELSKRLQVLVPMDRKESIANFGTNYSGEHHNENHFFDNTKLTKQALSLLQTIMQNGTEEEASMIRSLAAAVEKDPTWENKQRLNTLINGYLDQMDDQNLLKSLIKPKEEYTPKDVTDNRNI